ncbi:MAG: DUF2164 family protein [Dehalococcoidia bacterium]
MPDPHPWELAKEERDHALFRLRKHLHDQYGSEEWGELAVTMLLDAFEEQVAPLYYNRGITTAQRALRELADSFEVNTDALKRYPKSLPRDPDR